MSHVGDMLRLARQRKGLTQKIAAERLGVPQPFVSRYENSAAEPDEDLLLRAAQVYDLPRAFFALKEPVYGPAVSVHPMPRAKASLTARDLDMVTAELNIRAMHLRRFLEGVEFSPTQDIPRLDIGSFGTPKKIASVLRAHWQIPSGPIKNLTALVERSGAIVATSRFGGASVSGMTFRVPGLPPLILLNADHPADRMRFTLAHELGHIVMHRFPTATMENEANEFASAFLLPPNELSPHFYGQHATLQQLASMKLEWRVSMQGILYAARREEFVSDNQYRYLMAQIAKRGWRTREPVEYDFPHEQPQILQKIIRAQTNLLGYTMDELLQFVPMHGHEFKEYYGAIDDDKFGKPRLRLIQ